MTSQNKKFTTVSLPAFLVEKIKKRIRKSGFPSVSSYVAYVLREIEAEGDQRETFGKGDEQKIKQKLKDLGYL